MGFDFGIGLCSDGALGGFLGRESCAGPRGVEGALSGLGVLILETIYYTC